ncbi:MAG: DUF2064 domain-containing protein [Candidatus Krumholzibacteriia bacterium]
MLGIFAKVVRGEPVKTRLQSVLTRGEAERIYLASLADTLETSVRVVRSPVLLLQGGGDEAAVAELRGLLVALGLDESCWDDLRIGVQRGDDLGERLERAFIELCGGPRGSRPTLIVGSDSPSLGPGKLRRGLERLGATAGASTPAAAGSGDPSTTVGGGRTQDASASPDVVLGPTADGGYYAIGVRRPFPGLLRGVAWSTEHALEDTRRHAGELGLRVELLEAWSDVDHPEDLHTLARQIAALRSAGDTKKARHTETVLRELRRLE